MSENALAVPQPELLPIAAGEHKTRQGLRAFVVRTNPGLRCAYGFVELARRNRIYRQKKTWSQETGEVILSRGHASRSFDLVSRIDPRFTPEMAARWDEEHSALIEQWEWAKD